MVEISILILLVVFCYLLGKAELRALKLSSLGFSEQLLLATSLGLGSLAVFMFTLGVAGLYYRWLVIPVLIVAMLLLIYFNGKNEYLSIVSKLKQKSFKFSTLLVLIVLLGLFYSLFQLIQCASPVVDRDSLSAYLQVPKLYMQHHGLYSIDWFNWDDLPLNIQMLNTLGILLYSEILSQLISGWLMGILCSLAVYVIARRFVKRSIALISAVIFYTIPTLAWLMYSTKVDLGYTMFELCFWALFLRWLQDKDKRLLYISAIFLGLAIGSKYHALFALVFAALVILISLIITQEKFRKIVLIVFTFCVIALAIGSPSYIKNYVYTGDPFCPYLSNPDDGGWENINQYRGLLDYARFQYNMVFNKDYFLVSRQMFDRPIGPLIIVFLPFLMLYQLIEKRHRAGILTLSSYYLFLSFIVFKSVFPYPRHFLPAIGLLAVINGYGLKISAKWLNKKLMLGYVLLGLLCVVLLKDIGFSHAVYSKVKLRLQYLVGTVTKTDYLKQSLFGKGYMDYEMIQYTKSLAKDARIITLEHGIGFYTERPVIREGYFYTIADYDSLFARLRENGITYVYFSKPAMDQYVSLFNNCVYSSILEGIPKETLVLELQVGDQYLYKILYD